MIYKKITVDIKEEDLEGLSALLLEEGIGGYEVIDDKPVFNSYDLDVEELRPDLVDMKGRASVIFYLMENENPDPIADKIQRTLSDARVDFGTSDEADWRDKWKDYFHPFTIGNILIKPSWENVEDMGDKLVIEIDPGVSFGTGAHETTRMCIEALTEAEVSGKTVLDAGCGSGILSIAASKLGAKEITLLDIDPDCIKTSMENLSKNDCPMDSMSFLTGDIITNKILRDRIKEGSYDIIVANILADIVVGMLPIFKTKLASQGILITSGIIEGKENLVEKAMEGEGFTVLGKKKCGEWYMITGRL